MDGQGNMGGFGFDDILNDLFGGGKQNKRGSQSERSQPSVMNMTIDFNESVFGATKVIYVIKMLEYIISTNN